MPKLSFKSCGEGDTTGNWSVV
uniref:Uncharacterized protein n=1 Tax=Oryza glumipatula TaxID=40148 RepID=A0A0E0B1U1_9ORYZ